MLAEYAASLVDKNTAVLSWLRQNKNNSAVSLLLFGLSTPFIRPDSRLHRRAPAALFGCSVTVSAPVLADYSRDSRELSVLRAGATDSSLGLVSFATQPSLFFSPCPSPPTSARVWVKFVITQAGSRPWQIILVYAIKSKYFGPITIMASSALRQCCRCSADSGLFCCGR